MFNIYKFHEKQVNVIFLLTSMKVLHLTETLETRFSVSKLLLCHTTIRLFILTSMHICYEVIVVTS